VDALFACARARGLCKKTAGKRTLQLGITGAKKGVPPGGKKAKPLSLLESNPSIP